MAADLKVERKCSLENLIANGEILHPGFLRAGRQEGDFWQKAITFHSLHHEPGILPLRHYGSQLFFFFFQLSLAKSATLKANQRDPPRVSPSSSGDAEFSHSKTNPRPRRGKIISPKQISWEKHLFFPTHRVHFPANKLEG